MAISFTRPTTLHSLDRQSGIQLCHDICSSLPIRDGERTIVGITAGGDVGKSFTADAIYNFYDDDQVKGDVPRANKMMLESRPSESMDKPLSRHITHNGEPVKFTIVRKMSDFERLPKEDGPEVVVFMHTDTQLPRQLNPDLIIHMNKFREGQAAGGDMPLEWKVATPEGSKANTPEMKKKLTELSQKSQARLSEQRVVIAPRRPPRPPKGSAASRQ